MDILSVQFQLTTDCNERCIFCRKYTWKKKEASIEMIKEKMEKYSNATYQFSGGEPTMYSKLKELNELLVGKTYKVYTNGSVLGEDESFNSDVKTFLENATELAISFDAIEKGVYNAVRRPLRSNAMMSAMYTAILYNNKSKLSMVVTRENVSQIPEIIKFANSYGIKTRFYPLHTNTDDLVVLDDQLAILKEQLSEIEFDESLTNVNSIFEKGYFSTEPKKFIPCGARNANRLIDEDGREYYCCYAINDNGEDYDGKYCINNAEAFQDPFEEYDYCERCSRYRNFNKTGDHGLFL